MAACCCSTSGMPSLFMSGPVTVIIGAAGIVVIAGTADMPGITAGIVVIVGAAAP